MCFWSNHICESRFKKYFPGQIIGLRWWADDLPEKGRIAGDLEIGILKLNLDPGADPSAVPYVDPSAAPDVKIEEIKREIRDRFGPIPIQLENLLSVKKLKIYFFRRLFSKDMF